MNIAFGDETIILYMHITCVQDKYHHQQQIYIFLMNKHPMKSTN